MGIDQPSEWFRPGHNNTDGCGQKQTWELPFGFEGNSTTALPVFQKNLKLLHENGVTVTMTMGSWCTSFPVAQEEEWTEDQFGEFVSYFQKIREETFGGYLDGIDFDWEGYCSQECLKGANACHCGWGALDGEGREDGVLADGDEEHDTGHDRHHVPHEEGGLRGDPRADEHAGVLRGGRHFGEGGPSQ